MYVPPAPPPPCPRCGALVPGCIVGLCPACARGAGDWLAPRLVPAAGCRPRKQNLVENVPPGNGEAKRTAAPEKVQELFPEPNADAARPGPHPAGLTEKSRVLGRRRAAGLPRFHPADHHTVLPQAPEDAPEPVVCVRCRIRPANPVEGSLCRRCQARELVRKA
jgi:hypothetical protein